MFILSRRGGLMGRLVAERLQRFGHRIGILGATPQQADAVSPTGQVTGIPLESEHDLARHLAYGRALLLLPEGPDEPPVDEAAIVAEAARAGIARVVRLGLHGSRADSPDPVLGTHGAGDAGVARSRMSYSLVHPHLLVQDLLLFAPSIRAGYPLLAPASDPRIGLVDVRDVADTAVALLQRPIHQGETFELTGPRAWSFPEVAAALGDAIGRSVPCEVVAGDYALALQRIGLSARRAASVAAILAEYSDATPPTRAVSRVTGLPPRALEMFMLDHRNHFANERQAYAPVMAEQAVVQLDHALSW